MLVIGYLGPGSMEADAARIAALPPAPRLPTARKHAAILPCNVTRVVTGIARRRSNGLRHASVSLGRRLEVLICSITGFHRACSVSVRGRDGRGLWPRTWSSRYRNAVGTTHGRRAGDLPRRKREARPDTTRGSPSRRAPSEASRPGLGRERPTGKIRTGRTGLSRRAARWASTSVIGDAAWRRAPACGGVWE